ncbi:ATP-binding protein, partial [Frankia nepalensis]|uniref:ATP-binding protein n=1 Tax=Frankia nepalensis TaxID=1836974 RepID=UPI00288ADF97
HTPPDTTAGREPPRDGPASTRPKQARELPPPVAAAVVLGVVVGVMLGVGSLVFKTQDGSHPMAPAFAGLAGGYLFLAAGAVAHFRDPGNRVGPLMVLAGCGYFAEDVQLTTIRWLFPAGLLLAQASTGPLTHLVLAFPDGRLGSRAQRLLVGAAYALTLGLAVLRIWFNDTSQLPGARENPLFVWSYPPFVEALSLAQARLGALVALGVLATLARRWWRASSPRRRVLAPVFLTGIVGAAASATSGLTAPTSSLRALLLWVYLAAFALLPLGFLAGVPRMRLGRTDVATVLARLAEPLPPAELRDLLARALGDPSLRIAYWRPEAGAFVDGEGQPFAVALTDDGAHGGVTLGGVTGGVAGQAGAAWQTARLVERDGRRVAALLHDPALRADPRRLDAVVVAAGLALDNQRLAAEVRAQLAEVRASRGRIVEAADAERRRIERDLHDGAQQRLVATRLLLRMARDLPASAEVGALLARAADGLDLAIAQLRELARGIHPAILTDAGLVAAVDALVDRLPVDVRLLAGEVPRLSGAVEASAYFVVAEAVTNALRHAQAGLVIVEIRHDAGRLRAAVTDDGVGGADLTAGTGLLGLRDRLVALGGTLTVDSPAGRGTTVAAELPAG